MKLIFAKSKWELWGATLEAFLQRVKADGFQATEIYLASQPDRPQEVAAQHARHGLGLIAQVITDGKTPQEHLEDFERQFALAHQAGALFVNAHAGRDYFPFEDNLRIFQHGIALGEANGLAVNYETHRGRPTFSAVETRRYLEALPELRLTADFSHWMVVHESDLRDQEETLEIAIQRVHYLHARVGHAEGPQVAHPGAPEWKSWTDRHIELWQRILDRRKAEGEGQFYLAPEFGPPAYMPTLPFTNQPLADTWQVNVFMKGLLQESLRG